MPLSSTTQSGYPALCGDLRRWPAVGGLFCSQLAVSARVVFDRKACIGDAWRICEREVALIDQALGWSDGNLSECRKSVILQRIAAQLFFHWLPPTCSHRRIGRM